MEYVDQQAQCQQGNVEITGPGKCLCKTLKKNEECQECSQILADWEIYHTAWKKEELQEIHLSENKNVPIGNLHKQQSNVLYQLLD